MVAYYLLIYLIGAILTRAIWLKAAIALNRGTRFSSDLAGLAWPITWPLFLLTVIFMDD
jgi:hypothetical protein